MIVVDSSALLAILLGEAEQQKFQAILSGSTRCVMSAVNAHETAMVLRSRAGPAAVQQLWQTLDDAELEIIPFDTHQLHFAATAFDRYGKGIDPQARLNLADCAAYALAKSLNAPLLFKGDDFPHTDLQPCL